MGEIQIYPDQSALSVTDSFNALVADIYDSTTRTNGFEPFLKKLCEYTNSASANMSTVNVTDGCFIGGWLHGSVLIGLFFWKMEQNGWAS